jgi:hypothetical protein
MFKQMHFQNVFAGKSFSTLGTLKHPFFVYFLVIEQLEFSFEILQTDGTLLGFTVRVRERVRL